MKVAVKQPGKTGTGGASMPTVLDETGELCLPEPLPAGSADADADVVDAGAEDADADAADAADAEAEAADAEEHEEHEEQTDDGPVTVPADVCCLVPGCGRRHGRMCTFPAEGEMRSAWTSVLEAVFPDIDVNAPEPKLKLLCEDHFDQSDFDEKGLIQPDAVPTRFPGGVKVIYNRDAGAGAGGDEPEPSAEEQEETTCCVPGCLTSGPANTMFPFPEAQHRAWTSIISAATGSNTWRRGDTDPVSRRPLHLRVCREHFAPECFDRTKKKLKPEALPSLFDGGKKKVVLRPASKPAAPAITPKSKPKPVQPTTASARKTPVRPRQDPVKKQGPVFVNVTDDGLQLLFKNGNSLQLTDLTLAELRRIRDCLKDKLRTDVPDDEKTNLELCLTQVTPVLEKLELQEAQNPEASPVMLDVMALEPDMNDPDVRRLVDNIKQVDCVRREYERSLARFFEDSDSCARQIDAEQAKITLAKKKISALETTYLRHFKFNDQRQALSGTVSVRWGVPTLTQARDIIQKIGKTAYARLLTMGFPLPSADTVSLSMERAHAQNVPSGLVEVTERRNQPQEDGDSAEAAESDQQQQQPSEEGEDEPPAKRAKPAAGGDSTDGDGDGEAESASAGVEAAGPLQGVTAEQLQSVLAGRGTLQDAHGRTIRVSLAEVPGAPPGAKTVVMETPDDAGHVRYVPNSAA